jgi:polysaccharide export outer membrane protein
MVYFQDRQDVNFNQEENLRIKPGDLLTIRVSAPEQEAAQPFNLTKSIASIERIGSQVELETYMVSDLGNIEFPVIGTLKVEGLNNFELSEKIKKNISNYVQDPIVNVRILNFKISVLGEVKNPGTFSVEDDHLSLSKALGMAGDLTINGRRDNILIMREVDGKKTNAYLDITDSGVVNSAYYNIKQNDVIYVEPRGARRQAASGLGVVSSYLSIASVLISFVILLTR